jgi:HEAT repeat protein
MPLTLACSCGQHYAVEEQHAGQQVPCPMCGQLLTIPHTAAAGGPYQVPRAPGEAPSRSTVAALLATLVVILVLAGGLVGCVLWLRNQPGQTASPTPVTPREEETKPAPAAKRNEEPPPPRPRIVERPRPPSPPPPRPAPPRLLPASSVPWQGHSAAILSLAFDSAGRSLWTASGGVEEKDGMEVPVLDSTLRHWDAGTGREADRLELTAGIAVAAVSPTGRLAAVAASGGNVVALYDLARKEKVRSLAEHDRPVCCLAFSADGKVLLSGGEDGLVVAWDTQTGKLLHRLERHTSAVNQVVVAPGGKRAVSVSRDFTVRVWDLDRGREERTLSGHGAVVWAAALSPDGRLLLTAGDNDVRLWDVDSGKLLNRFAALSGPVSALALSPDARRFLAAGHDGSVRLWQVGSGKEVKRLAGHAARVRAMAFFPDGRRAVSGGDDRVLRLWDLPPDLPDLVRDLRGSDAKGRLAALAELARMGEDARLAVAELFEALHRRDELRGRALDVLRGLAPVGKEHVARLDRLLGERDFTAGQLFALDELARLGEEARPAAKALLAAVEGPNPAIRRKALAALTPVVEKVSGAAFRPLLAALDDPDPVIRAQARKALDRLGEPGEEQLGLLRGLLGKDREEVRRYGLKALGELGETARPALADIAARARRERSPTLRELALEALGKIAPADRETIDAATHALKDTNPAVACRGANLLAGAGDVPGLVVALEHDNEDVRATAGKALEHVRFGKKHVGLLVRLVQSRDDGLRRRGVEALGRLGTDGAEAVPALAKALKGAEDDEQKRVLGVLRKMGGAAREAGPAVAALLRTKERARRREVCAVLVEIEAAEVKKAVSTLIDLLRADDTDSLDDEDAKKEREKARDLLVQVGKPAVKPLTAALTRDFAGGGARAPEGILNGAARREVIKTLVEIGTPAGANEVLLALAGLVKTDPFPAVRKAAREAYVKLQRKE